MKLVDLNINEYMEILGSRSPAPGGGSASALSGAQGAALIMMVSELTIGREKYRQYEETCLEAQEQCRKLLKALMLVIDEDTEAYNQVMAAYKLPKETEVEKAERKKAIAAATLTAAEVPYKTMELSMAGLKIAETLTGKCNPNAISDLGTAAACLLAGFKGAWLNVKINMPGVEDKETAEALTEAGERMYKEAKGIADKIYKEVLGSL